MTNDEPPTAATDKPLTVSPDSGTMDRGLDPGFKQTTNRLYVVGTASIKFARCAYNGVIENSIGPTHHTVQRVRFRDNRAGIKVHAAFALSLPPSLPPPLPVHDPDARPSS